MQSFMRTPSRRGPAFSQSRAMRGRRACSSRSSRRPSPAPFTARSAPSSSRRPSGLPARRWTTRSRRSTGSRSRRRGRHRRRRHLRRRDGPDPPRREGDGREGVRRGVQERKEGGPGHPRVAGRLHPPPHRHPARHGRRGADDRHAPRPGRAEGMGAAPPRHDRAAVRRGATRTTRRPGEPAPLGRRPRVPRLARPAAPARGRRDRGTGGRVGGADRGRDADPGRGRRCPTATSSSGGLRPRTGG